MFYAVITGDVVASTSVEKSVNWKNILDKAMKAVEIHPDLTGSLRYEIFQGDGFQIELSKPEQALFLAVLIRAVFKAGTHITRISPFDVRLSISIGKVENRRKTIRESDGEAYRVSGRNLLHINDRHSRIVMETPWKSYNEEIEVALTLLEPIIRQWSATMAFYGLSYLLNSQRQEVLAEKLKISQSTLSQSLSRSNIYAATQLINRSVKEISRYIEVSHADTL